MSVDTETNAAEVLRSTPTPDDAGAETADRYEWQAMMATADALSVYLQVLDDNGNLTDDVICAVICEHHEDWAVIVGTDSEIVSGKHREASVGPFSTYLQILDVGGVLHLYKRWDALGGTPLCRLVTTAGLSNDAAKLERTCSQLRDDREARGDLIDEVVSSVARVIGSLTAVKGSTASPPPVAAVRAFLASLRFQDSQPRRDHLPDMAAERYGRPVAERLGCVDAASAIWQAVLALVKPRMRAAGPSIGGELPTVVGVPHDDPLARRTLNLIDVHTAIRFAVAHLSGYAPLPRLVKANKMAIKMAQGGCSDNAIERADALRLQYRRHWRALRSNPSTADRRRRLDNALLRIIDEATYLVRVDGTTWGAELWFALGERFRALEGDADAQGLDAELLLGGVSELANNCSAWYTDSFDAAGELRRLVREEAAL
ncbi:hypothetical protein M2272_001521 [Mycobacterium frederiksbergense]|uniref:DUF4297 domain-containing protein n=1 Tax=Mycolicibacterium frederiksbergense TaxID=117567 RepID=A0ABT6KW10_9MYCO|nr:hypothetical protein [Mycolicibacterium frederiksbergense]MDH6194892.1 hypothetical protein [Mycolicibacterium frederiksbergense]